ncbi:MAG: AAA family ATPase [Aeriscardovia sp.]|nr:AAA family ATPase [Aeriscardovia sp.]
MTDYADQLAREQKKVDSIYARLDELSGTARKRLARVRAEGGKGSPTHQAERDSFAAMYEDRLTQLRAVEDRLVFGRLDSESGETSYIGRIGLSSEDHDRMLTDWRAEAARPFYEATAEDRMGLVLRRHLSLKYRTVAGIEDEVLDIDSPWARRAAQEGTLNGEGALLASLSSRRTSRMADIVATIQAEQDRVIRAPLDTVTIVQGGPGTGKTAVALHRAAYLLYTHRRRLSHSGVLVVGPSDSFLHYIGQVLPSLGETGVLSRTIGTLLPGFEATGTETPLTAKLKGDARMADAIRNAVQLHIRVPKDLPTIPMGPVRIPIAADDIRAAQNAARRTHLPHNRARVTFVNAMISALTRRYAAALPYAPDADELDHVSDSLRLDDVVKRTLNLSWLPLTATWLLRDLWAKPRHLRACAPWLSDEEAAALERQKGSAWTSSDIPLLDEAMELIGDDPRSAAQTARERELAAAEQFAKDSMATYGVSSSMVSARQLVDSMEGGSDDGSLIDKAARDRSWTYGHIVVDEAQELTAMDWRMLRRRCPSRSFTIVGDVAQTSALGGTRDWATTMDSVFGAGRWQLGKLTIDYRNPKQVAELANAFARSAGLKVSTTTAARETPDSVSTSVVPDGELVPRIVDAAVALSREYLSSDGTGRVAVVADAGTLSRVEKELWPAIAAGCGGKEAERLRSQPAWARQLDLVTPQESKGLEYDAVLLAQPGAIEASSASRLSAAADIYVSMTRPTQKLLVMQTAKDAEAVRLAQGQTSE